MRIPTWALTAWVVLALLMGSVGSYLSYTQSRQRTRELNNIASVGDGVDVVEVVGMLGGWRDPELPDVAEADAPAFVQPTQIVTTPAPTTDTATTPFATDDAVTPPAETETPAPTDAAAVQQVDFNSVAHQCVSNGH